MLPLLRTTRAWPFWLRLAAAAAAVGGAYLCQLPLEAEVPGDPFLLFLLVILACTLAFGQGLGLSAVVLSAFLSTHFFEPGMSLRIHHAADLIRVELYAVLASLCVVVVARSSRAFTAAHEATLLLAASESKKTVLLRELGHRVANNFATVASLIRRQAAGVSDPHAKSALDQAIEQVNVMARVHRRLHAGDEGASVDSRKFLVELCDDLSASMATGRLVSIECIAISRPLPLVQAVALGLIVNELVTNALKYAFPDDRTGSVRVHFEQRSHQLLLSVADDGVGMRIAYGNSGMGQQLVRALCQQLGGQLDIQSPNLGSHISVTFPSADRPSREVMRNKDELTAH
jgi:two-component sensor histidine kinase